MKALFYGDNLQVLRDSIATENVDLIYLDLPFNSNPTYNVGLPVKSGRAGDMAGESVVSHKRTSNFGIYRRPMVRLWIVDGLFKFLRSKKCPNASSTAWNN